LVPDARVAARGCRGCAAIHAVRSARRASMVERRRDRGRVCLDRNGHLFILRDAGRTGLR
jgi:hypothetical protein